MQDVSSIKADIAALGAATEVGFRSDPADVERIHRLANELEAMNPTAEPSRAAALLRGRWRLLYSSFELQRRVTLARISLGVLPETQADVVDLYNEIDPASGLYDNIIHLLLDDGTPATHVMACHYAIEDDNHLDIWPSEALLFGPGPPLRLAAEHAHDGAFRTEISYLDDGFRMVRGNHGSLYILERLDPAPMRWARET